MSIGIPMVALLLSAAPHAGKAAAEQDPIATVRAFYKRESIRAYEFYSARLKDLFVKDDEAAGGDMGNLSFDFIVNGQDVEDGWRETLRYDLMDSRRDRATVRVTFRNGKPQDIHYTLVRERGRWLIDDARSVTAPAWVLSEILKGSR